MTTMLRRSTSFSWFYCCFFLIIVLSHIGADAKKYGNLYNLKYTFTGNNRVRSVDFSPDGTLLISGDNDGVVKVWETGKFSTGVPSYTYPLHTNNALSVRFNRNGKYFVSGGYDNLVGLWETGQWNSTKGTVVPPCTPPGTCSVYFADFSPVEDTIAVCTNLGGLVFYRVPSLEQIRVIDIKCMFLAFSPDGRVLATGSYYSKDIHFWDVANLNNNAPLAVLNHLATPYALAYSHSGHHFAVGGAAPVPGSKNFGKIYQVHNGTVTNPLPLYNLCCHLYFIYSFEYSSDDSLLFTSSGDGMVNVYNSTSTHYRVDALYDSLDPAIYDVSYSENYVASCASDNTIDIYEPI